MGAMFATCGHGDAPPWAVAEDHQRPWGFLGSGPPPTAMFLPEVHAATRVIQVGEACTDTWSHDFQAQGLARGPCLGLWPHCGQVGVDVLDSYYHQRLSSADGRVWVHGPAAA